MTEDRLSALSCLSIEKELARSIDVEQVVNTFAKLPDICDVKAKPIEEDRNCRKIELL